MEAAQLELLLAAGQAATQHAVALPGGSLGMESSARKTVGM